MTWRSEEWQAKATNNWLKFEARKISIWKLLATFTSVAVANNAINKFKTTKIDSKSIIDIFPTKLPSNADPNVLNCLKTKEDAKRYFNELKEISEPQSQPLFLIDKISSVALALSCVILTNAIYNISKYGYERGIAETADNISNFVEAPCFLGLSVIDYVSSKVCASLEYCKIIGETIDT